MLGGICSQTKTFGHRWRLFWNKFPTCLLKGKLLFLIFVLMCGNINTGVFSLWYRHTPSCTRRKARSSTYLPSTASKSLDKRARNLNLYMTTWGKPRIKKRLMAFLTRRNLLPQWMQHWITTFSKIKQWWAVQLRVVAWCKQVDQPRIVTNEVLCTQR